MNKTKREAYKKKIGYYTPPRLLYRAKRRAKENGLEITIDKHWILSRLFGTCELTGLEFSREALPSSMANAMAPSIDRIDSNKGYTPNNCRLVLWCVNRALGVEGEYFLYKWAKAFVNQMESNTIV